MQFQKNYKILLLFSVFGILMSCEKFQSPVWMNYAETYCNDPWTYNTNNEILKTAMETYLNAQGISILDAEILSDLYVEAGNSCTEHTGRRFTVKIYPKYSDAIKKLGFYAN
jgi:hypothetical protein